MSLSDWADWSSCPTLGGFLCLIHGSPGEFNRFLFWVCRPVISLWQKSPLSNLPTNIFYSFVCLFDWVAVCQNVAIFVFFPFFFFLKANCTGLNGFYVCLSCCAAVGRLRQSQHIFFCCPSFFVSSSVNKCRPKKEWRGAKKATQATSNHLTIFIWTKGGKPAGHLCSMQNIMPPLSSAHRASCVRLFFWRSPSALQSKWHTAWHELACFVAPCHLQEPVEHFPSSSTTRFHVFFMCSYICVQNIQSWKLLRPALEWTRLKEKKQDFFLLLRFFSMAQSSRINSGRIRINFIKCKLPVSCVELQIFLEFIRLSSILSDSIWLFWIQTHTKKITKM